jgi:hypothetical protein
MIRLGKEKERQALEVGDEVKDLRGNGRLCWRVCLELCEVAKLAPRWNLVFKYAPSLGYELIYTN